MPTTSVLRNAFLVWLVLAAIVAGVMRADALAAQGLLNDRGEPAAANAAFFEGVFLSLAVNIPLLIVVLMLERIATDQAASLARLEARAGVASADPPASD